jgi:hypothetical protein
MRAASDPRRPAHRPRLQARAVAALLDAWWLASLPLYKNSSALATTAAGCPYNVELQAQLCSELELNLHARQAHVAVHMCALIGSLLSPQQVAALWAAAWPWTPTFPGLQDGLQLLRDRGEWPRS